MTLTMKAHFVMTRILLAAIAISLPMATCFSTTTLKPTHAPKSSALYSIKNRRELLQTITATAIPSLLLSAQPPVANAAYGGSSNIVMPNYIEYLIEKNNQGLVDPSDLLYKGPDIEVQLRRIGDAGARLPEIAALAEEKKWSQVQGIITGPLGTLLQTMNSVASAAGTKEAKDAANKVKTDLFEISAAAGRKDKGPCVKAAGKAAKDLEKFVMVAFK